MLAEASIQFFPHRSHSKLWATRRKTYRNVQLGLYQHPRAGGSLSSVLSRLQKLWAADALVCPCFDCVRHDIDVAHEHVHHAQEPPSGSSWKAPFAGMTERRKNDMQHKETASVALVPEFFNSQQYSTMYSPCRLRLTLFLFTRRLQPLPGATIRRYSPIRFCSALSRSSFRWSCRSNRDTPNRHRLLS